MWGVLLGCKILHEWCSLKMELLEKLVSKINKFGVFMNKTDVIILISHNYGKQYYFASYQVNYDAKDI